MMDLRQLEFKATGTVRENRLMKIPFTASGTFKKKAKGTCEVYSTGAVIACKWNDNAPVCVASNFDTVTPYRKTSRWNRKKKDYVVVDQPLMIKKYNNHMGGLDTLDRDMADYRPTIRAQKWYWPLFNNTLNMAVVASWRLLRIARTDEKMDQLAFREQLAEALIAGETAEDFATPTKVRGVRNDPNACIRFDGLNHLRPIPTIPEHKQWRCKWCGKNATTMCDNCNVALHVKCSDEYHAKP